MCIKTIYIHTYSFINKVGKHNLDNERNENRRIANKNYDKDYNKIIKTQSTQLLKNTVA